MCTVCVFYSTIRFTDRRIVPLEVLATRNLPHQAYNLTPLVHS